MGDKKMKAAVLTGPGRVEVREVPAPRPADGEMEIEVSACGVCGSDVHMWKDGKGWAEQDGEFHMGHEFCGVVTDPGTSGFKKGERVVFWANLYCGECDMCRDVNGTYYIGFVCNGGYAQRFVGRASNAYRLPDTVSDVAAGLIDPLMAAYHAIHRGRLRLYDKVLVVGTGIIGHLIGSLAKSAGASEVSLSYASEVKTGRARELQLFDHYIDGTKPDAASRAQEISEEGFDIAFEAVGSPQALQTCLDSVRPGGRVVMIGNSAQAQIPFSMNEAVFHEIELIGSVSCTRAEFEQTIGFIDKGIIDPEKFVTDILPLDERQRAFERQADPDDPILKAVIRP